MRNSPKTFLSLKKRAAQIKVLLMDVDGTMTDRGVNLLSQTQDVALEIKTFDAHDGRGHKRVFEVPVGYSERLRRSCRGSVKGPQEIPHAYFSWLQIALRAM